MPSRRVGRRRDQRSWLDNVVLRARLSQPARNAYPDFGYRRHQCPNGGVIYSFSATVPVEGYEPRHVSVLFDHRYPTIPTVLADGPSDSPHRYRTGDRRHLCLWFPHDPPERTWVPADGLLHLFGMITIHLLKEAWWRETGRWVGEEYPHGEDEPKQPVRTAA
jgi:hypothetical protein